MYKYRVTKFDPAHRAADGTYQASTWTSVGDIGARFAGSRLTVQAYLSTEDLYIRAIETAFELTSIKRLHLTDLESSGASQPGNLVPLDLGFLDTPTGDLPARNALTLARAVLRELVWGKLEGSHGFYVHFGWDYYMYIGGEAPQLRNFSCAGLFVEPFTSPYSLATEEK